MTPNSSLGNVISRLQGLKNVSGRKVMPGAEYLQELEEPPTDVAGTASPLPDFSQFLPSQQNQPEPDLGGELTPQSYDVRANVVNNQPPENPQDSPGFWSKVGTALADYVNPQKRQEMSERNQAMMGRGQAAPQTPPIATAEVDMQEGLPPVTASQQEYQPPVAPEQSPGFLGAIKDYFSPTKRDEMSVYNNEVMQNAQLQAQGQNPAEVRGQHQASLQEDIKKAMENPMQYGAYGSANEVANSPALKAQFQEMTGINYDPQVAAEVTKHEEAMKGVEDALSGIDTQLSEQAEAIKQRILTNQTTESDKYYLGLALLMPLLIGGIFGKEAGLGALGGAAKGFADVLGNRQKGIKEDEESLLDISKQRGSNQEKLANLGIEKSKLPMNIRKNLPEQENKHLMGMQMAEWTDPATGEVQKGVRLKPGLVARSEYVNSPDAVKDMRKSANEIAEVKTYVDDVNSLTDDVIDIVGQLKDPTAFYKGFTAIMSGKVPGALSKLTQDVEFEGRKQNAGTLLEEKLGFLANKYGMAQQLGQLDRAAPAHIKKIMDNPTSTLLSPKDALNQMLEVRKLVQNGLINQASNAGFYPEFLVEDLEKKNNKLYGKLNQKDDDKYNQELKRKASQHETKYGK